MQKQKRRKINVLRLLYRRKQILFRVCCDAVLKGEKKQSDWATTFVVGDRGICALSLAQVVGCFKMQGFLQRLARRRLATVASVGAVAIWLFRGDESDN